MVTARRTPKSLQSGSAVLAAETLWCQVDKDDVRKFLMGEIECVPSMTASHSPVFPNLQEIRVLAFSPLREDVGLPEPEMSGLAAAARAVTVVLVRTDLLVRTDFGVGFGVMESVGAGERACRLALAFTMAGFHPPRALWHRVEDSTHTEIGSRAVKHVEAAMKWLLADTEKRLRKLRAARARACRK